MHCTKSRSRKKHLGFTLLEVLLVMFILVIMASLVIGLYTGQRRKALDDKARIQIGVFEHQIDLFEFNAGHYPSVLEDLLICPANLDISKWAGPYLKDTNQIPLDPWDRQYKYSCPGRVNQNTFDVWSSGNDGIDGSEDDIGNWKR